MKQPKNKNPKARGVAIDMISFGPVPSRRLGRSLGVNNIPPKTCTYSCVYCQVGRTTKLTPQRTRFCDPAELSDDVSASLSRARARGKTVDYATFVPDGEPTLDINLGESIKRVRDLGVRVAVITNGSLLWKKEARSGLAAADWVSVKVDSTAPHSWARINRPHRSLELRMVISGLLEFAQNYGGRLVTETMLVRGLNDAEEALLPIADLVGQLHPDTAYISIPTRPPAEAWVEPPGEDALALAYGLFSGSVSNVEHLVGYEGDTFSSTGDVARDLLNITAVHPMRREAVEKLLREVGAGWRVVERLLEEGDLTAVRYRGRDFFVRSLPGRTQQPQ